MSQVTIACPDKAVYIDGLMMGGIDCSAMPADIRVVQWNDEDAAGHIEFVHPRGQREKPPNETITDFSPFEFMRAAWQQRKVGVDAARAALETKAKGVKP